VIRQRRISDVVLVIRVNVRAGTKETINNFKVSAAHGVMKGRLSNLVESICWVFPFQQFIDTTEIAGSCRMVQLFPLNSCSNIVFHRSLIIIGDRRVMTSTQGRRKVSDEWKMKIATDYENMTIFQQVKTALEQLLANDRAELTLKATTLSTRPADRPQRHVSAKKRLKTSHQ